MSARKRCLFETSRHAYLSRLITELRFQSKPLPWSCFLLTVHKEKEGKRKSALIQREEGGKKRRGNWDCGRLRTTHIFGKNDWTMLLWDKLGSGSDRVSERDREKETNYGVKREKGKKRVTGMLEKCKGVSKAKWSSINIQINIHCLHGGIRDSD